MINRKRLLIGGGAVAFVIGIGLLAFAALGAFDSGGGSKSEIVIHFTDTPSPAPVVTRAPAATPVPTPPLGDESYSMVVDKIGVDAPVQAFGLDANQVPEIPRGRDAAQIVAWYNFSAKPGTGSNAVFAGYVAWYGTAVFYRLTDLTAGDQIKLRGQDGTLLTYKISNVFYVDPNDPIWPQVVAGTPTDTLTMFTWDVGYGTQKRLVIRAELQQVTH